MPKFEYAARQQFYWYNQASKDIIRSTHPAVFLFQCYCSLQKKIIYY